ncbi:MAG TPA: hypothetical protein DCL35_07080 [Candidatus Omnitrophica bacterium]|nr:hypothetical protein [Candidatus Omnitrophota bacterium]
MKLNIVDIVTSGMRAVNKTLRNMSQIVLTEMPELRNVNVVNIRAMATENTFTSVMILQQKEKDAVVKGGLIVYISKFNIKNLFGALELDEFSGQAELEDMCGEFCNVIAGCFKTELVNLGYEDVQLSLPENFYGVINQDYGIEATAKHTLNFSNAGRSLLTIDVFMEKSSTV